MYSKLLKKKMESFLEKTPQARERSAKDRAIARLLQVDHVELGLISIEMLTEVVGEALSLDRAWRATLERRPDLRGSDYSQKATLEAKTKVELGYNQFNG